MQLAAQKLRLDEHFAFQVTNHVHVGFLMTSAKNVFVNKRPSQSCVELKQLL